MEQLNIFHESQGSIEKSWCVLICWRLASNFCPFFSLLPAEVEAECEAGQTKYHVLFALTLQTVFFFFSFSSLSHVYSYNTSFCQPKQVGKQDFCICLELLWLQDMKSIQQWVETVGSADIYKEYSSHYFHRFPPHCLTPRSVRVHSVESHWSAEDHSYWKC